MGWEAGSAVVVASAVCVIALLERIVPYDGGQRRLRAGFWTDLVGYTIVQSYVLAVVISALITGIDAATGLSRHGLVSAWPIPVQVAFFVVTHDLYIYWFHRWQHRSPWLWRLHEAHHSNEDVDWLAGARSHSLEILVNQTVEFAPMLLLGAAPEVPLVKGAISAVWGLWIHANVDVRTGWLQLVLNGPEAHRWHHAQDREAHDTNFATKLALWDRLFGTAYLPRGRKPSGYGLPGVGFPRGYIRQHLFAFRPFTDPRRLSLPGGGRARDHLRNVRPPAEDRPCPG
jgi:sterol desaturase/sphingolipid hydroxylase (fatty acid hydroxylase superfamily)